MSTAIDTIAIEMMVPAEDELLLTSLVSTEGVADAMDEALGEAVRDFDAEGFGAVRAVLVGEGVAVGVGDGSPVTTTVPLMPAWIEQWYEIEPGAVNR